MYFGSNEEHGFERPVEVQGELYRARPIESYDTVCLRGQLTNNVRFFCAFTHAAAEELPYQIEVRGTRGWARVSKNGTQLDSSWGTSPCQQEDWTLMQRAYRSYLDYVEGKVARPPTLLRDTLGYSLTTNALLQSSGGIHSIDSAYVGILGNEPDDVRDVSHLRKEIEESFTSVSLFSEKSLPWAVPSSPILLGKLEQASNENSSELLA
jgi:hypothetical protein